MTKEEWSEWRQNPLTKKVLKEVLEKRQGLSESLAKGHLFSSDSVERTALNTAKNIGGIQSLDWLLNEGKE